jgi:hypothetical protein
MKSIGSPSLGASTILSNILQHKGLDPFRSIIPPREFATVARMTDCLPQRKRALTPQVVAWLMMLVALHTTSMTQGLYQAWSWVSHLVPKRRNQCVSEEAFTQARNALPLRFWGILFERLGCRFHKHFDAATRWKGLRVLAGDGSLIDLPNSPQLSKFFGHPKGAKGPGRQPQGRLVALCSVFTGFCVAFKFAPLRFTEHVLLRRLLKFFKPHDLVLLDRGFFSYDLIQSITARSAHYLQRLSDQMARFAETVKRLGPNDWMVRFKPTTAIRWKHPTLPEELRARLIRYQMPGFRPSYLLTSLTDLGEFTRNELVNLYHRRWQIETIYREWKHTLDIQNLRSKSPLGISKEIHAHLIMSNLVRWMMSEAGAQSIAPVELSFTTAISHIKSAVSSMVWLPSTRRIGSYRQLLLDIRGAPIRQRSGRSYPRLHDGKVKNMGKGKHRLPARISPHKLRKIA